MTGLVRGLAGGMAGAVVALAAHYGLALDQETVAIVLTAVVGALATGAVHWAEGRWPAVARLVGWLSRTAAAVPSSASSSSPLPAADPRPAGTSNVRRVPWPGEPTTGPQTPRWVSSAYQPPDQPPSTP